MYACTIEFDRLSIESKSSRSTVSDGAHTEFCRLLVIHFPISLKDYCCLVTVGGVRTPQLGIANCRFQTHHAFLASQQHQGLLFCRNLVRDIGMTEKSRQHNCLGLSSHILYLNVNTYISLATRHMGRSDKDSIFNDTHVFRTLHPDMPIDS